MSNNILNIKALLDFILADTVHLLITGPTVAACYSTQVGSLCGLYFHQYGIGVTSASILFADH